MERRVVEYDMAERVATITLNRPERLNAWTGAMSHQYRAALLTAATDEQVRVIVVTGAGRGFCAGADSDALQMHADAGRYDPGLSKEAARPGYGVRPEFDADLAYHFGIDKPIIAALNGPAAGIGLALACYCDLRMAARGAKLTSAHGRLGLPAEFGLSWLLPRLIGFTRAADLLLSSRIFLAEEAAEMGLVNSVHAPDDLMAAVSLYATALANDVSPLSIATTKRQLYSDIISGDPASSIETAIAKMSEMMGGEDYRKGVAALREKRSPRF
ncbi:MAG: enoyl-CoA hydratase-related protein [Acidimicrobiales bacterium]